MLHSHLRPQGSKVWASSSNQECIPTKCKEDSTTWLVVWNLQKGNCHTFFKLCAWCGKWRFELADAKPQFKHGAFDDTSHNPWARQSLCKRLCSCDCLIANPIEEVHIYITTGRTPKNGDVHRYNVPTANEVAMIIPSKSGKVRIRDVIVQWQYGGGLQRMNELAPFYDPLQYPLLFFVGEDEWSKNLQL
jgi:hypothetical protein